MNSIYQVSRRMIVQACWLISVTFIPISVLAQGPGQCQKPEDLQVVDITESSANLMWASGDSLANYEVEIRSKGRTPKLKRIFKTSESSLMVEGLVAGSDYKFRVRANCSGTSTSGSTKWFSFQTDGMSPDESCPKATNLMVSNSTFSTATLAWTPPDHATHFEVEVRSKGNTPIYFFQSSTIDTSVTVFGLTAMDKYQFRVRTMCENTAVSGSTSWLMFVPGEDVDPDTCDIVSDLVVDSITTTSALIHWSSTDGDAVFMLTVSDGAGFDATFAPASNPSQINGLVAGTEYTVELVANCTTGLPTVLTAGFSTLSETTDSCAIPSGLMAESLDSSSYALSWNSVGDSTTRYQLQIDDLDSSTAIIIDTTLNDPIYQFLQMDSIEGYLFRVKALCSETSTSDYSEWQAFPSATDSSVFFVCDPPSSFKMDSTIGNNTYLSWTGPLQALFQIQVQTSDTLWSFVLDAGDTSAQLTLFDLDPFTDYEVRVRSLCSNRESSEYTDWLAFTTQEEVLICQAPTELHALRIDDSTAFLSWMAVDTATYIVEVEVIDTGSQVLMLSSQDTAIEVSGLSMGLDYQFRVKSVCAAGDTSDYSQWFMFNLADTTTATCDPPADIVVDSLSHNSAMISWTALDQEAFRLFIKDIDTIAAAIEFMTDEHFYYFDSLMPETEYELFIQSICGEELSGFSESIHFTTLSPMSEPDSCDIPSGIALDSVDANNAWISWQGNDSFLYEVEVSAEDTTVGIMFLQTVAGLQAHLEDLASDASYLFRVRTLCSEEDTSAWSDTFAFQTLEVPDEPEDSCAVPVAEIIFVDGSTAQVSWTQSSENAFYLIEVENIGLTGHYTLITTTRDTSYLIEGLMAGGTYQWKVAGFCDGGTYSDCSPWMTFETDGESVSDCLPPNGLAVTIGEEGSATLSWEEIVGAIDYEVEVESQGSTPFYGQNSIVLAPELMIDGLSLPGSYQFKVNVQCADGSISEDTDWYEFVTDNVSDTGSIASGGGALQMAFPNPAQTYIMVKVPEMLLDQDAVVELSDMMGRTVLQDRNPRIAKADLIRFNVGNLREGIYQLRVRSAKDEYHELVFVRR
ncbi:MAG: hypothetical protein HKN76_21670 [Saprospiraceae bacterium]|nr:hypothetical protein [Saprospiraceae bacterium]